MDDELVVTLGGLRMFGRPGLGLFGIVKDGLDGWDDGVAMRGEKQARPQAHGSMVLPNYQESRTVTITGIITATSARQQAGARDRITGLLSGGGLGRLEVQRSFGTRWADAQLENSSVDPRRGSCKSDFQIQLWCPDARIFGDANGLDGGGFPITMGQSVQVFHYGNAAATPLITVTGDFPNGYTLTGPDGKAYVVTAALAAGTTHTIDMTHGLLRTNQYYFTGGVGDADVWTIPPGQQITMGLSATSGSGTAVIDVLDTYI
jgi:hypothetical protein